MVTQYPLVQTGTTADDRLSGAWADYRVSTQTVYAPRPPAAAPPPPILKVLSKLVLRRWKLLAVWTALTLAVIGVVLFLFGKPVWRAEGKLRHEPNYGHVQRPLVTPPNIQDMLAMTKEPEILEIVHSEFGLPGTPATFKNAVRFDIDRSTNFISVAVDNPNRELAVRIADRIMEIAIDRQETARVDKLTKAIAEKEQQKRLLTVERQDAMRGYESELRKNGINVDIKAELERLGKEIADQNVKLGQLQAEALSLPALIRTTKAKIEELKKQSQNSTPNQSALGNMQNQLAEAENKLNTDRGNLKDAERELKIYLALPAGAVPRNDLERTKNAVETLRANVAISERNVQNQREKLLKGSDPTDNTQLAGPRGEIIRMENRQDELRDFEIPRAQRLIEQELKQQKLILAIKDSTYLQEQDLANRQQAIIDLTQMINENRTLLDKSAQELKIKDPASTGPIPVSSNYPKLAGGIFAAMMLLFLGFVAWRDLPNFGRSGAVTAHRMNLPVLAHCKEPLPDAAGAVSPAVQNLAAQVRARFPERGSVVLFTPADVGTPVEKLVGELAALMAKSAQRVLVFDARDALEGKRAAWVDHAASEVGHRVEAYLEGRSDQPELCFAPTPIPGVDFSRASLARHADNMIGTYRFNRLVAEMRERYDTAFLIGPAMAAAAGDHQLASLVDGTILVLDDASNPPQALMHAEALRAGDNPPLGAIVYEGRSGGW